MEHFNDSFLFLLMTNTCLSSIPPRVYVKSSVQKDHHHYRDIQQQFLRTNCEREILLSFPEWQLESLRVRAFMARRLSGRQLQRFANQRFSPQRIAPLMSSSPMVSSLSQPGLFESRYWGRRFLHHRLQSAWDAAKYVSFFLVRKRKVLFPMWQKNIMPWRLRLDSC